MRTIAPGRAETEGLIKVVADKSGRILGGRYRRAAAGELFAPWSARH